MFCIHKKTAFEMNTNDVMFQFAHAKIDSYANVD